MTEGFLQHTTDVGPGPYYDPEKMKSIIDSSASSTLITPSTNLPEQYENAENLTLDQIDARDVRVGVKFKKSYRWPRVRLTNNSIIAYLHPNLDFLLIKQLVALAVEARRRLRHPNNQVHAEPFKGPAWGSMEDVTEDRLGDLVVKVEGREVTRVSLDQMMAEVKKQKSELKRQKKHQLVIP